MLAKFASSRIGFELIRSWAWRHPHFHLHDLDGSLYMGRWWIVAPNTWQSRVLQFVTGGKYHTVRLHHIMRHDHDRDLHSHPFAYHSTILSGWYEEVYRDGVTLWRDSESGRPWSGHLRAGQRRVSAGDTVTGTADKFHRIQRVSAGGVWTMFAMSKNEDDWGFLVDHQLVPAAKYLLRKGWPKDQIRDLKKDNPR